MILSRKRLSFGALVADFYCLGILMGATEGLYVAAAKKPTPLWLPFLSLFASTTAVVIYHAKLSRSVRWFSPGEVIFGRQNYEGNKWWANPYRVSRAAMFGLVFFALVWWGNLWDR